MPNVVSLTTRIILRKKGHNSKRRSIWGHRHFLGWNERVFGSAGVCVLWLEPRPCICWASISPLSYMHSDIQIKKKMVTNCFPSCNYNKKKVASPILGICPWMSSSSSHWFLQMWISTRPPISRSIATISQTCPLQTVRWLIYCLGFSKITILFA